LILLCNIDHCSIGENSGVGLSQRSKTCLASVHHRKACPFTLARTFSAASDIGGDGFASNGLTQSNHSGYLRAHRLFPVLAPNYDGAWLTSGLLNHIDIRYALQSMILMRILVISASRLLLAATKLLAKGGGEVAQDFFFPVDKSWGEFKPGTVAP
jgi:hypothetical protein